MENYQQDNIPYHLILDEVERELSPAEALALEQWKAASPENLAIYNTFKDADDRLALLHLYRTTDVDDAWGKMSASLQHEQGSAKGRGKRKILLLPGALAAAAVITGISVIVFNWYLPGEVIYRTANEQKQIDLPDGSHVFLNERSAISFIKRSFQKKRHVKLLEGEAYFEVLHDDTNEFLVELGDVVVRDIGTTFNIKTDTGSIQVIVNTGAVSMEDQQPANAQKVVLAANQMALYNRYTKSISSVATAPPNYKAWQDKKLRYVQTPLSIVCQDLNRIYGTRVVFQDSTLKERKLNAYLNQKTEEQIMQIIAASLQLKIVKKDSAFIISP